MILLFLRVEQIMDIGLIDITRSSHATKLIMLFDDNNIDVECTLCFFPLLVYLNMNGVKSEWPTITAVTAFFVVADRSHHGYVSTSNNMKVFCQQGYLPE